MKKTRNSTIAVILSLLSTGVGQIYCGKLIKGLFLFFIGFIFVPIIDLSIKAVPSTLSLIALLASVGSLIIVNIYSIIDAFITAKKINEDFEPQEYNKWYVYLLFIIVTFTYPTNFAINIRNHIVSPYRIASSSMAPNILKNDYIFLNKIIFKKRTPKNGDVVVFICPNKRNRDYIKRIVAMPGDKIEIRNNRLIINGKVLKCRSVSKNGLADIKGKIRGEVFEEFNGDVKYNIMIDKSDIINLKTVTVPNGHCFVLGDNRNNSNDSRNFGPVPLVDVKGRVDYIYLPVETWKRFGRFKNAGN